MANPAHKVRVRCLDTYYTKGNVYYVDHPGDYWRCRNNNGVGCSLHYAGILDDQVGFEFMLDDCTTVNQVLDLFVKHGSSRFKYTLV